MLALLGTDTDRNIATRTGQKHANVVYRRNKLGIAPFVKDHNKSKFPEEFLHLLGTDTDANIAKKTGLSAHLISYTRRARGLPGANKRGGKRDRKPKPLSPDLLMQLGRAPDLFLAAKFNVPAHAVRNARIKAGIAPLGDVRRIWTPEQDEIVRTHKGTIDEIAAQLGKERKAVLKRRNDLRGNTMMSWAQAQELSQPEFIKWCLEYSKKTRRELAAAAYVSFSRIEKWAAPGTGAEPLTMALRRLLYLTAIHAD